MHNTLLDNIHALWTNAAAGAVPYWSAANLMSALLKPAGKALMTHDGTVPGWLGIGSAGQLLTVVSGAQAWANPDVIHALATINNVGTTQNTTSTSPTDVTGASVNLTLTRACKIIVFGGATGLPASGGGSYPIYFHLSIDGTAVGNYPSYVPYPGSVAVAGYKSGVASGSRNVKLQFSSPFGITVTSYGAFLVALAVPD
jgi:hypothetical protein